MTTQSDEFLRICAERIAQGEAKYGPVRADDRNRCKEAIEEVFDVHNYLVPIMLAKHPRIKITPEWQYAVTLNYRLYKALLALEQVERQFEKETLAIGGAV